MDYLLKWKFSKNKLIFIKFLKKLFSESFLKKINN